MTNDEDCYRSLADEFNDPPSAHAVPPGYEPLTLDDFVPSVVAGAERFARANGLAWPPGVGDFDRYYEWRRDPRGRYPLD